MHDAEIAKAPVVVVRGTFMAAQPPKLGWGWERDYWTGAYIPLLQTWHVDMAPVFDSCDV